MASKNNNELISKASLHTQKKFELIEKYIMPWAQKLMNNVSCKGLAFIDCMCNSGLYRDENGATIEGTPLRVAHILRDIAGQYPFKQVYLYFNDRDAAKTALLSEKVPKETANFHIEITCRDASELLKAIGPKLNHPNLHYFLLYDPYDASINWEALLPFFRYWGEVMINHMVSDPVRAIGQVKKESTMQKYEGTYLSDFEELVPFGSDKVAYEKRVLQIINALKGQRRYYVAAYPFYNTQNSQVYSLIHCTSNPVGFELYKTTAWQTFGAHSSNKNTHGNENQLMIDWGESVEITTSTDESCFNVHDIAKYIQEHFEGQDNVLLEDIYYPLKSHPIFPSDGYRSQIKEALKSDYGAKFTNIRNPVTGAKKTVVSFRKGSRLYE
jgi:three-Cys-motif partner protein